MDIVASVLKWLSQVLIVGTGTWAIFSETCKVDPGTVRRRLTSNGWAIILLLVIGFLLFGLTELRDHEMAIEEARLQAAELKWRDEATMNQTEQLEFAQELIVGGKRRILAG